ncbi:MAG: hypothetical protein WA924_17015 [Burkholderiaceae bacterium]
MAFQVGPACYSTELQAAQAQASQQVGSIVQHGSAAYVVDLSAVAGDSITYVLQPLDGGSTITKQVSFTAQPCNLLTAQDGLTLGWLVVGVWVAAYCVIAIARVLRGETGGNDGNA